MQQGLSGSMLSSSQVSDGSIIGLPIERRRGASTPRKSAIRSGDASPFSSSCTTASTACSLSSSVVSGSFQLVAPKVGNAVVCRRSLYTRQDADVHVLEGWSGIVKTADISGDFLVEWDGAAPRWVKANHVRHLAVVDAGASPSSSGVSSLKPPDKDELRHSGSTLSSYSRGGSTLSRGTPRSILKQRPSTPATPAGLPRNGECVLAVGVRRIAMKLRRGKGGRGEAPSPKAPETSPPPSAAPVAMSSVQQEALALLRGGSGRRLDESLGRFPNVFIKP